MKNTLCLFIIILGTARMEGTDSTYYAVRSANSIVVDGMLSEAIWKSAPPISGFLQRDPAEGKPTTQETIVRIVYDDNALYVGARMNDSSPDSIVARISRRDEIETEDFIAVALDTYHDHRSGFFFGLSAGGTLMDGTCYNDDYTDDTWDGVWDGRVYRDAQGWTAEFRIPFSQLRFKKQGKQIWGVNFRRDISRRMEETYLVYTPKGSSGFVSRFPHLAGIDGIEPPRHVEVLPYVRTKAAYTHPDADDPFHNRSEYSPDAGADIKIGLSNSLTLDMTVNPDFGQVEVDPAVVNLSDAETYFNEKRPFFIEGASTFNFGVGGATQYWGFNWSSPQLFYSRRIGRSPQGEWPDNDFADVPDGVHILGAAKVSGKVGKWNIGTIHALTRKETGSFSLDGNKFEKEVEPVTYYGICRAQREIDNGLHGLGIMSTWTERKFDNPLLKTGFNSRSKVIGADGWTFLDTSRTWVLAGWVGGSHVSGTPERMIELQKSSGHYFQRPDSRHIHVDSSATSLSGYAGRFYLNKQRGSVIINTALGFISPGFDVNDMGYFNRANWINGHIGGGYLWIKPNKVYRWADIIGAVFKSTDFEGNNLSKGLFLLHECQYVNYMSFNIDFTYNPETINKYRTRGGPLTKNLPGLQAEFWFETDNRKPWVFSASCNNYWCTSREWNRYFVFETEWKPGSNVDIQVGPGLSLNRSNTQWVDAFEDVTATNTYGTRYVFGEMMQTEISANIRVNWTFTPRLSFQLYLQPLISHGDFENYKELEQPKSYDFAIYTKDQIIHSNGEYEIDPDGPGPAGSFSFDNQDFDKKSLRGNAVLRWEYKPGSTLYLVWTQNRWDEDHDESFSFSRSLRRLSGTKADNIFMLKATYWWSL